METGDSNSKIVLSVRVSPSAKQKLVEEAEQLGTTLSEHAERILLNAGNIKVTDDSDQLKLDNALLSQQIQVLKSQPSILNNLVLLKLFEQLKGRKDEVETPDGKTFGIIYNSPLDLLTAMIHSFKLKP